MEMKKVLVQIVCVSMFSLGCTTASAQLGDFLKGLKSAVEEGVKAPVEPAGKPAPSSAPAAPSTPPPQTSAQPTRKSTAGKKLDLEWPESEYLFACNIKGKTLSVSKHLDSDDPNIRVSYGKRDEKTLLTDLDFRSTPKIPLLITEQFGQRRTITSIYFTLKDSTYSISRCEGMMCNPEEMYWLAIYKNGKLGSQEFCEEEPMIDWNMPVLTDKSGKLRTNPSMKDVMQVRPSKINFDLHK
jgi:hypothetical protein